jgi:V8-like Glu-specific endopeptidase
MEESAGQGGVVGSNGGMGERMRQRGSTGRTRPALLGSPAALAAIAAVVVTMSVAATSTSAQGAARMAVRLAAVVKALPRRAPTATLLLAHGRVFDGTPAVGALFTMNAGHLGGHFCTASVVASPGGDLVITAAHCVTGQPGRYAFAPGYHNGWAPYGIWTVTAVIVDQAWENSANPDDDVAFLKVRQGRRHRVQDLTGADRVGTGWGPARAVQVIGYPEGRKWPITCQGATRAFGPNQLEFDCGGFTNGTSGGPFLVQVSSVTGLGTVIGVIGGYEQGGYTPSVSYSPRFRRAVAALYRAARAQS